MTRIRIDARIVHGAPDGWLTPGAGKSEWFKDIDIGPEMVVVPPGSFTMGSNDHASEAPPHKVTIKAPFAAGRFAVTFAEWDAAGLPAPHDQPRCLAWPGAPPHPWNPWGRGRQPLIDVSWEDAKAYASWLSQKTGKAYRLLSEAEWEYVARAGTTTKFWWGDDSISIQQANFDDGNGIPGIAGPVPVDRFEPNPWGLYQVHGNVWEWCEDNWHANYQGAPQDGSVWVGDKAPRVVRGGAWNAAAVPNRAVHGASNCRSAARGRTQPGSRTTYIGFRLARTL